MISTSNLCIVGYFRCKLTQGTASGNMEDSFSCTLYVCHVASAFNVHIKVIFLA